ncbi:MAG: PilZ domain-containing protein [Nitrospina sp.]|jgi:c-di-GMP-binding flagellar brake protein YcgR|nr:PilZ domain-containing protein [Nitrospina sp.]MBT3511310.1 PilZ domain-containing protein [Nitrospina sp.]MBT3875101.1 PilZ domain-containing protein [Nitrospina sp.]MBT4047466.1 PilZ domain-containing protein [Nitrospina sp.]MBT4558177.1 PilZ domain-containing protein [Nitrospina sp.]
MVSKYDSSTKRESVYQPIARWLRKLFRLKSREIFIDSNVDRRDFYRLEVDPQQPLDLCLTMQDEHVYCTTILDMSASGFGCHIKGLKQIHGGQPVTAIFALPLEEPVIIKSEVYLVSVKKGNEVNGDIFRFRYFEGIKDEDRDLIHRYIVQQQFAALEKNNPDTSIEEYEEIYPEALSGN